MPTESEHGRERRGKSWSPIDYDRWLYAFRMDPKIINNRSIRRKTSPHSLLHFIKAVKPLDAAVFSNLSLINFA